MSFSKLEDFKFKDKKVLVRVDFNVPLHEGEITDDSKIKAALPTLKYILKQKPAKLILMSHLGRPRGQIIEELRLDAVQKRLAKLGDLVISKTKDPIVKEFPDNLIVLLENVQFNPGEIENSEKYAKKLASYADIFVLDAFGQAHRNYASLCGIQKFLPSCAGLLLENEIEHLSKALNPARPYVAIIGGAKMDKIYIIENMIAKADKVLFGGVLANTLLMAAGKEIGVSIFDHASVDFARELLEKNQDKIILPIDVVLGNRFHKDAETEIVDVDDVHGNSLILDIGPKTIELFKKEISSAKTITWTGPIGVFEFDKFAKGTEEIVNALAKSDAITIIGGGDSAASVAKYGLVDKMTHVSTGGGASLEFLGGKKLAAIEALEENLKHFA